MKLRQKLALVLATAMVVTAVPVTTMAKSTNEMNKVVSVVKGSKLTDADKVFLNVDVDNQKDMETTTFFVETEAFEFNKDLYTNADSTTKGTLNVDNAKIEILSKTEARVTVTLNGEDDKTLVSIPVYGEVKEGTPALIVDGKDSIVTSGKYFITTSEVAGDKAFVATAGTAKNISVDGEGVIADITIEERIAGAFDNKGTDTVTFELQLPNRSDLDFDAAKAIQVEGKRGHANKTLTATADYKAGDKKILVVTVKGDFSATERGSIVLKGIGVQPENSRGECRTGEVKVTLKGDKVADTSLVVANVAEYDTTIEVDGDKVELTGGKATKKVKVKVKETAIGSLDDRKDIYFTVDGAHFVEGTTAASIKINDEKATKVAIKDGEIQMDLKDINRDKINTITMEFEVYADVNQAGPITLVAESKNFTEDMEVEIGTVKAPFAVKAEALTVKVGLQSQVGGKIAISETDKGMFEKGETFTVKATKYFDIDDAKVEVTEGDLEIESKVKKDGTIEVTIKRPSSEASTITISGIEVTTNRMLPEGKFDVVINGEAISERYNDEKNPDEITVEDFFVVGTKNTEDLPNAAAAKEIVLTVGSTAYTVNGEAKTADAAAFIDASNRTMVPVRFVAEEFGKVDFGTINGVGTVTIFKDGAVLQFQNGSNIMNKNGINIPMDTKVVIKDGRTYVPFKYVADGLGIGYSFDAATKSITFTNQVK